MDIVDDMKIMQDLFAAANVNVSWENVSESVYTQQKNLIFSNKNDRPDAIYHADMSAGEIIKYAKRGVLVAISDYLEYMPNLSKILEDRPLFLPCLWRQYCQWHQPQLPLGHLQRHR